MIYSIKNISLSIVIIGTFLLLFIYQYQEYPILEISSINSKNINKNAMIIGQVTSIKNYPSSNFQILALTDKSNTIPVTIDTITNIQKFENLSILGKINVFNDKFQLNAEKIISLDS